MRKRIDAHFREVAQVLKTVSPREAPQVLFRYLLAMWSAILVVPTLKWIVWTLTGDDLSWRAHFFQELPVFLLVWTGMEVWTWRYLRLPPTLYLLALCYQR